MHSRNHVYLTILFVFFGATQMATPCNGVSQTNTLIPITEQESLQFLVEHSDIIAIIEIYNGIDGKNTVRFNDAPKEVNAKIILNIKGEKTNDMFQILSKPKFLPLEVKKSILALRNGKYLAFLSRDNTQYLPTTRYSLLDITNNRVHPVWKDTVRTSELTSGYSLDEIIADIKLVIIND